MGSIALGRKRSSKRSGNESQVSSTAWMVTFSDLLTLLLTLFVMRLSMSSLNNDTIVDKIRISDSSQETPIKPPGGGNPRPNNSPLTDHNPEVQTQLSDIVVGTLTESLGQPTRGTEGTEDQFKFSSDISFKATTKGAVVSLGASTFQSGSAELTFKAAESVLALGKSLRNGKYRVRIAGHTDNIPINTVRFPSNWELSAARAVAVARQMIDAGVEDRVISAVGYADTKPLEDNRNAVGRHLNRRVEIYLTPLAE